MAKDIQFSGRKQIITNQEFTGDLNRDVVIAASILQNALNTHKDNVRDYRYLFDVFFNDGSWWSKDKETRADINNKVSVASAWNISRTINSYCFNEPIKYISRDTGEKSGKQEKVELLSEYLDYSGNHNATVMGTLVSSVCGVGYKLVLPAGEKKYKANKIPFVINKELIMPENAFCVYSNDTLKEKVMGVIIGDNYNSKNEIDGNLYTVWTDNFKFIFKDPDKNSNNKTYELVSATANPVPYIPLVEIKRNAFRKGDWEVAIDLMRVKNLLLSNREDDIQQAVDYVMVLINCDFENDSDAKDALKNRLFKLTQKDSKNAPSIDVLKTAIDQQGVQTLADYIDDLINEITGIPSRNERSGGGHDTGQAVIFRNGFRDLENNAGLIVPQMDIAETQVVELCLAYAHNMVKDDLAGLEAYDVRNKFVRTFSDEPTAASMAYSTFRGAGMNDLDALIASKAVTDPAEVHKNNEEYRQMLEKDAQNLETKQPKIDNKAKVTDDDPKKE